MTKAEFEETVDRLMEQHPGLSREECVEAMWDMGGVRDPEPDSPPTDWGDRDQERVSKSTATPLWAEDGRTSGALFLGRRRSMKRFLLAAVLAVFPFTAKAIDLNPPLFAAPSSPVPDKAPPSPVTSPRPATAPSQSLLPNAMSPMAGSPWSSDVQPYEPELPVLSLKDLKCVHGGRGDPECIQRNQYAYDYLKLRWESIPLSTKKACHNRFYDDYWGQGYYLFKECVQAAEELERVQETIKRNKEMETRPRFKY
jgi:hypothetical protein